MKLTASGRWATQNRREIRDAAPFTAPLFLPKLLSKNISPADQVFVPFRTFHRRMTGLQRSANISRGFDGVSVGPEFL